MTKKKDNYGVNWQEAIESFFESFVQFFYPVLHAEIDWKKGHEFLDEEFQQILTESEKNDPFVNKLVKVWLNNGKETWLLAHFEAESQPEAALKKQIFSFGDRISRLYGKEIVPLVVLGDQ